MASNKNETTTQLLEESRLTMKEIQKDFVFACGGSLPHITQNRGPGSGIDPVTIRRGPRAGSTPASRCKITFPPIESQALSSLITSMQQASFGLGGEDVVDESYRRALKLDTANLSTNFCPYNAGIMNTISQPLVPSVSENQTAIDHHGETMIFDWGSASGSPQVQWAAFYSDCEHEVLQVHSGQRVTLTYNLYACALPSDQCPQDPLIDTGLNLPLAQYFKSILSKMDFMPQGGFLGVYTTHAYPNSSQTFQAKVQSAPETPPLKGIDRALWQMVKAFGCRAILRPAVDFVFETSDDDYDYDYDSDDEKKEPARVPIQVIGQRLGLFSIQGRVERRDDLESAFEYSFKDHWVRSQHFE